MPVTGAQVNSRALSGVAGQVQRGSDCSFMSISNCAGRCKSLILDDAQHLAFQHLEHLRQIMPALEDLPVHPDHAIHALPVA